MFPNGIDDGRRELDVEVTKKHNAVFVLKEGDGQNVGENKLYCQFTLKELWMQFEHSYEDDSLQR